MGSTFNSGSVVVNSISEKAHIDFILAIIHILGWYDDFFLLLVYCMDDTNTEWHWKWYERICGNMYDQCAQRVTQFSLHFTSKLLWSKMHRNLSTLNFCKTWLCNYDTNTNLVHTSMRVYNQLLLWLDLSQFWLRIFNWLLWIKATLCTFPSQSILKCVKCDGKEKTDGFQTDIFASSYDSRWKAFSIFLNYTQDLLTVKCTECCLLWVVLCLFCLAALNMHTETNKQNPICLGKVKHCLKLM